MIPLIVIRPQPGADATATAATALGLTPHVFPLFAIAPVAWVPPDPGAIDALLIGSANAVRHAGPALAQFRGKPAYAVGQVTAAVAQEAGLTIVALGGGGLDSVLAQVTEHARVLRLAGRERVPLHPPTGVLLTERIVYASNPLELPSELTALLRAPAVVLLHSAAAAEHFAHECDRLSLDRAKLALVTIGPRVTAVSGTGWAEIATAAVPDDAALLARACQLCQNRDGMPGGNAIRGAG